MKKSHIVLLLFTLLYLAIYSVYYFLQLNYEFSVYIAIIFFIVFIIVKKKNILYFDDVMLWGISLLGLLHLVAGSFLVNDVILYGYKLYPFLDNGGDFYILKFDQVVHLYGYLVIGMMMFSLVQKSLVKRTNSYFIFFIALCISIGLGVCNEIIEFIVFTIIKDNGVGGFYNLGLDLIFNLVGAFGGVLVQLSRCRFNVFFSLTKPLKRRSK